jgi:hypothetical protein
MCPADRLPPDLLERLFSREPIFDPEDEAEETPPDAVVDPASLPYLLDVREAAAVLRTTPGAIYARVERGQLDSRHGLRRTGRKIQFLRDALLRSLERGSR